MTNTNITSKNRKKENDNKRNKITNESKREMTGCDGENKRKREKINSYEEGRKEEGHKEQR